MNQSVLDQSSFRLPDQSSFHPPDQPNPFSNKSKKRPLEEIPNSSSRSSFTSPKSKKLRLSSLSPVLTSRPQIYSQSPVLTSATRSIINLIKSESEDEVKAMSISERSEDEGSPLFQGTKKIGNFVFPGLNRRLILFVKLTN